MSISLFRSIANQYENLRSVNSVPMMNVISHHIEDQVINHKLPVNFYAGFERFSYFPDQLRRYGRLGAVARRVYVLGVPDVKPPSIPGIEFIEIEPNAPLAREWFLLIDTPDFWTVLLTQEVEGRDAATGGRRFDGLWSFDAQVVDRVSLLISQVMGTNYEPVARRNYDQQNVHIAEISSRMIERLDRAEIAKQRSWAQTHTLQKMVEVVAKNRETPKMLQDAAQLLHTMFGATGVVITHQQADHQFAIAAAEGDAIMGSPQLRIDDSPSSKAVTQGTLVRIADVHKSREREPLLPTAQTLIVAPLTGRQRIHGAVIVGNTEPNQWTEADAETIKAIASMLAVAMEVQQGVVPDDEMIHNIKAIIGHMMVLHRTLRSDSNLTPTQHEIVGQMDRLTVTLARRITIPGLPASQSIPA